MDDHIYRSLVESIRKHGVLQPILVRSDMTIVKGEKRWRAAQEAGLTELICVIVESTEEEAKLLTISLSHLRGRTNEELLASLLEELSGFFTLEDISLQTGFQMDELNSLILGLNSDTELGTPVQEDDINVQRALDEIKEPETRYGDVWQLGRHFLVCGDTTKLQKRVKAALVVTDPP
ncbi:ParB N-terminal domain-containing protein [Paenibacillus sp. Soil766]|uniref:ParB N-terminal domain-containing protein n=1 Tax=Paenibacillus sp. Soil766 TaxID=1736404 RepID=UPI000A767489|nr:ParB N-terminal domain-containing protein [Paenibacillus sp. Soil766]